MLLNTVIIRRKRWCFQCHTQIKKGEWGLEVSQHHGTAVVCLKCLHSFTSEIIKKTLLKYERASHNVT